MRLPSAYVGGLYPADLPFSPGPPQAVQPRIVGDLNPGGAMATGNDVIDNLGEMLRLP